MGTAVVKPVRGEQGQGITVGVRDDAALTAALQRAGGPEMTILIEEQCAGDDLRILVIDGAVVAAAVRRPATVVGTGEHTIEELISVQSRRRAAATGGESTIPLDDVTETTVRDHGRTFDDILPAASPCWFAAQPTCTPAARSTTSLTPCTQRSPTRQWRRRRPSACR